MTSDPDEALSFQRNALELLPLNPTWAISLSNVAMYLQTRFNTLGKLSDLDEVVPLQRNALNLWPQGNPDRPVKRR